MEYLNRQSLLFTRNHLSEVYPVRALEDESELFFIRGDDKKSFIGCMWLCHPIPGVAPDTTSLLESALSGDFPDDTMVTTQIVSSTLIDPMIQYYYFARRDIINDPSNPEKAELVEELTNARINLMKKGATEPLDKESGIIFKDMYQIITIKFPCSYEPSLEEYSKLNTYCIALEQSLESIGLYPARQDQKNFLIINRSILNPGQHPITDYDDNRELNEQIFTNEDSITVHKDHIQINDNYVKSLSVQRYPEFTALPAMIDLLGDPKGSQNQIPCPFVLTTTLYFPNVFNKRKAIQSQAKSIRFQNMGKIAQYSPKIGLKDENFNEINKDLEKGEKPVMVWTNLLIFGNDKEHTTKMASKAKNYFDVNSFRLTEDKFFHGPAFQQQLPLCITPEAVQFSKRFLTMTLPKAVHLLNVGADWKGNGIGANNMFYSRRGQVMLFDPFDSETNMNGCIFGEAGAGKSVFAQDLALGVWERGGIVRIIDSGRSYKKLTEIVGGEFIEFTPERDICLNPFTDIQDIMAEIPPLLSILEQMAAPKDGLDDYQMRMLEKYTIEAFNEFGNELTITELSEHLIHVGTSADLLGEEKKFGPERGDEEIRRMGEQFSSYTRHGPFGKYFDGPANLSMSGDWSVLELDDLQDYKELRTIALMLLITKLNKDFYGDRKRRKLLLVDEFWKFLLEKDLGSERIQKYLIGAFRLFRKYFASSFIASQAVTDITEPAILQNAANLVIMKQKKETIDHLEREGTLALTPYVFELLKAMTTKKGSYSELFITTSGRGYGFCRFTIDRFSQLIYSTDPVEVTKVNTLMESGKSLVQSINEIIAEEESIKLAKAS